MGTFLALLTGGGLAAVGGLLSGWLTNWLGDKRDTRKYQHECQMARDARKQDRLEQAYIELGKYLSRYGDWARAISPLLGSVSLPDPLPKDARWCVDTLVKAYGSPEVRRLLEVWETAAKKIENADSAINLAERPNPSREVEEEARSEKLALPDSRQSLFDAEDALRDQMSRELKGDNPPALTA